MPIKNYTASRPTLEYIGKVQAALIAHGANGIQMMFDGDGRVSALAFVLPSPQGGHLTFQLPCEWRRFEQVLKHQNVKRWDDDDYAYRVAWANLKDWVEAQMALYETQMVTMPQIFLPFVKGNDGRTLFEQIAENPSKYLLGGNTTTA